MDCEQATLGPAAAESSRRAATLLATTVGVDIVVPARPGFRPLEFIFCVCAPPAF
jgi:hypothetical protein